MTKRQALRTMAGCAAALCASFALNLHAQEFPSKPLRIIAPFSPGSGVDSIARVFAQRLSQQMHVSVVVENKEGAGGMIGAAFAAKQPADGSSLLVATTPFVVGPIMQDNTSYDPIKDFSAVGRIAVNPLALTVNAKVPANSMKELIDYARKNPGALTYASSGPGTPSQLEMENLKAQLKLDIREIPYRSNAQALTDVIAGTVSMYYTVQSTALGNVHAGQVRALAVAAPKPTTALPNVPTMAAAAGLPGYESLVWYGFVVPHGTPPAIVKRLNAEVVKAAEAPEVVEGVQKLGFEVSASASDEFARQMAAEARRAAAAREKTR
jgi:tripartite-type tricarboxylate transporter receptor subunit TctC